MQIFIDIISRAKWQNAQNVDTNLKLWLVQGNVTLWKPSDTAILSNYLIYKIFRDAGFPDGVVNFLPSDGPVFGKVVTRHPELAAVNFTGSVP